MRTRLRGNVWCMLLALTLTGILAGQSPAQPPDDLPNGGPRKAANGEKPSANVPTATAG